MKQNSKLVDKIEHEIHELLEEIREERDDLGLKIYLAKAEARDEWEKAETKWQELKAKADLLGKEVKSASGDVGAAAKSLAQELKRTYTRIHRQIKQL